MDQGRTHLNNISARDMSQFLQDQGTTTKVYPPVVLRGGSDAGTAEIGHIPLGVAAIFPSRCVTPRSQCIKHSSLDKPCGYEKIASNAGWRYY